MCRGFFGEPATETAPSRLELNKRRGGLGPPATGKHAGARRAPLPAVGDEDIAATELDREIAATDREIDNLVYELYGITDEERKIIEAW